MLVWMRHGTEGVKTRWALKQQTRSPLSGKFFAGSLLFWIVVAIALVFYFNMTGS
jgi:hypothetical protein